jgi:hypothetical protein
MRLVLIVSLYIAVLPAFSQSGPAKRALRALAENDLDKAADLISRGLEKDSLDALIHYDIARYQVVKQGPSLDSANSSERRARRLFDSLAVDDKEKYAKAGLTSVTLELLRREIDSLAFAAASETHTEDSYNAFLDKYPVAPQREKAIENRDSLAFAAARAENTFESYRSFIKKYPLAKQAEEARERYERLYFETSTAEGDLESFESFLREHPSTPYRDEIEYTILQMSSPYPDTRVLEGLVTRFRGRPVANHARNFLFYHRESDLTDHEWLWTDSLRIAERMNREVWIPVYEKEEVQFVDMLGNDKFSIDREILSDRYKCEVLTTDVIIGRETIYSRQGHEVYSGSFDDVIILPDGYLIIEDRDYKGLITTWGLQILPIEYQDIVVLSSGLIKAKNEEGWQLFTFTGRPVTASGHTDIKIVDGLHFLQRGERDGPLSDEWISQRNKGNYVDTPAFYDDYEILDADRIWLRNGDNELLIDRDLNVLVEPEFQRIEPLEKGYVIRRPDEVIIRDGSMLQKYSTREKLIDFNDEYARFSSADNEGLFDFNGFRFIALPDSARIVGNHGILAYLGTNMVVYQYGQELTQLNTNSYKWELVEKDDREWIILNNGNPGLVTANGVVKLPGYDDIVMLTDSIFIIEKNRRKSLFHANGREVLPGRYNGMGNYDGRDLSLLRNGKFGLYRPSEELLIQPEYEKILKAYRDYYFIAVKDNMKGLIDKENEEIIPFIYDEIFYWNDSVALVGSNGNFGFHTIGGDYLEGKELSSVQFKRDDDTERVVMGFFEGHFGIYSSIRGEVLPPTFDDIINIGSIETPVYFTETYVEQADLHVVVYYDAQGRKVRRQAFDPEMFAEILCED